MGTPTGKFRQVGILLYIDIYAIWAIRIMVILGRLTYFLLRNINFY
jgi:hypothetical protein